MQKRPSSAVLGTCPLAHTAQMPVIAGPTLLVRLLLGKQVSSSPTQPASPGRSFWAHHNLLLGESWPQRNNRPTNQPTNQPEPIFTSGESASGCRSGRLSGCFTPAYQHQWMPRALAGGCWRYLVGGLLVSRTAALALLRSPQLCATCGVILADFFHGSWRVRRGHAKPLRSRASLYHPSLFFCQH